MMTGFMSFRIGAPFRPGQRDHVKPNQFQPVFPLEQTMTSQFAIFQCRLFFEIHRAWHGEISPPISAHGTNQIRRGRLARGHRGGFQFRQRRAWGAVKGGFEGLNRAAAKVMRLREGRFRLNLPPVAAVPKVSPDITQIK
jgi:hypothetical protein